MAQMRIKRMEVQRKSGACVLHLQLSEALQADEQLAFCDLMKIHLPGAGKFSLAVDLCPQTASLPEVISSGREKLLERINQAVPGLKSWLGVAEWQCRASVQQEETMEHHLVISFPNRLGVDLCNQKRLAAVIPLIFHEHYQLSVRVELTVAEELAGEIEQQLADIDRLQLSGLNDGGEKSSGGAEGKSLPEIILGKTIKNDPVLLDQVIEEEKTVTVCGRVFGLDTRILKSGRKLVTFNITDLSDSIGVKIFCDDKTPASLGECLQDGIWAKVRGPVQTDRYSQELTLMAYDINRSATPGRQDNAVEKRVELHLHTKMSALDSVVDIGKAIAQAAKWGHPAIAITDHGVVQAYPEAYDMGQKYGIKIIYGLEGYLIDDENDATPWEKQKAYHVIIMVKTQAGLLNMYKMISTSHIDYYHRTPRILKSILRQRREGLIIGTACEAGELYHAVRKGADDQALADICSFYDFLEVQPLGNNDFMIRSGEVSGRDELIRFNKKIISLGQTLGKPVVATGDVHFLGPEDAIYRQILMAGKGFEDSTQSPLYLRTTEEMLAEFDYLAEADARRIVIEEPRRLAESLEDILPIPKELYPPSIEGAESQVEEMTLTTARQMYGPELPEPVQKRLDKELHSIITNGFSVLYLIAHKLVKKSNDDGYLVGSRGSVGSSLVATMMGITEVNPLAPHYLCAGCHYSEFITDGSVGSGPDLPDKACPVCGQALGKDGHDIPFETFLGFEGDKTPDIDLNFSGDYQPRAHKYVEDLFGKNHVFRAGTIATIAERTAFGFVKGFLGDGNKVAREAEVNRLVAGCTGVKRTTGQHPGGLMVVPQDLDIHQFSPIQRPADDMKSDIITTHFDYHSISSRLVKLDILGHDDPTAIKMLEDLTGVNALGVRLDDPQTMSLFSGVEILGVKAADIRSNIGTYAIPEFGTRFVRQMLEDTRPKTFSELVRISGFSHGTDVWLNNAQDLIKAGTCRLSDAISTRDDIMVYLMHRGMEPKMSFKIMEDVRKGKGLKPDYEMAMRQNSIPDWYIASCQKIKYMFPKAHATAYVTMAFRIAWFKVNYPEAFYATFFTVRADEFDAEIILKGPNAVFQSIEEIEKKGNDAAQKEKNSMTILEVALEMYQRNIKILPIDLMVSDAKRFQIKPGGILMPFNALPGMGASAAQNIVEARDERPFLSRDDIRARARTPKPVMELMAAMGTLDELPESSQMSLFG